MLFCCKYAARLAVVSNVIAWASGAAYAAGADQMIDEEGIVISLPVYIVSLLATAGFTWTIAKYDHARNRRLDLLEAELARSNDRSLALQAQLEDLLRQRGTVYPRAVADEPLDP